ncbi:MAG: glutathione S-transferase N-terminal domain-containing protein [Gaiellaceae bacterium]
MAVRLLRCSAQFVKIGGHPCWRVEKALEDMGIEYETVAGAALPWQRDKRRELIEKTGGNRYPAIEFEDGSVYREESKHMVGTIRAGKLFEKSGNLAAAPAEPHGDGAASV